MMRRPRPTRERDVDPAIAAPFLHIDSRGWIALGIGLLLAIVTHMISIVHWMIQVLAIIIHELGHTVFAWLFGYPSLPAIDLSYGGGVTVSFERLPWLPWVWGAIAALAAWQVRGNRVTLTVLAGLAAVYVVIVLTGFDQVVILYMGHGTELLVAGLFLYRALSGRALLAEGERPAYAWIGCFLLIAGWKFGWSLLTDAAARAEYGQAKGGGHWMDFSQLATHFGISLPTVAAFFLACCIITPIAAWAAHRFEASLKKGMKRLLRVPAKEEA